jgi:hypothetical protein
MKIQQTRPNKKKEKQTNTHHKHSPMNPTHDKKHDCKKKRWCVKVCKASNQRQDGINSNSSLEK